MKQDDRAYFRERAEEEIAAAQRAEQPEACKAHYMLAGLYLDRAYNNGLPESEIKEGVPPNQCRCAS